MANPLYKSPPIEEALVEFRFLAGKAWNLTIPGKLHSLIGEAYPNPRQQNVLEAAVQAREGQPPNLSVREGVARLQLLNEEGNRLVSVGPDVLSVNTLRPYDGWNNFYSRIADVLGAYQKVAEPEGVQRIGLRYINKLIVPGSNAPPTDYLTAAPVAVSGFPSEMTGFVTRCEYRYEDEIRLLVTQSRLDGGETSTSFLLDLDVIWSGEQLGSSEAALERLNLLHDRVVAAFEAAITKQAREVFDAD